MRQTASLVLCAVLLGLAACEYDAVATLSGNLVLTDVSGYVRQDPGQRQGGPCSGTGGYSDVRAGVPVTVRDADGAIVGTTTLAAGTYINQQAGSPENLPTGCLFRYEVEGLPHSVFYSVTIGHRGTLTYLWSDLVMAFWTVSATLGG